MNIIQFFKDIFRGYPLGARSGRWNGVRKEYLKEYPYCAVCGTKKSVEPHHILPVQFDVDRKFELDYNNLISLCRKNQCHLLFGHLRSFSKSYNPNVREDAEIWRKKILNRPTKLLEANLF
ncbi:MAG: HNH endonuclease signature motif containing protein [Patescibacteria group bacterium]|nr:HNH endonuclease signature motif containing protein [Patescibacteria group bacterium]